MSETPGASGWDQAEDRGPDPLVNQQGFCPRSSSQPPPAEQVRSLVRGLVFVALIALVVLAVFVALVIRSLNGLVL